MPKQLAGVIAPITTPFDHEDLNITHLRLNVMRYSTSRLAGFFVLGSNGENKSLTDKERLQVLEAVTDSTRGNRIVIAGSGFESTHQTISFSRTCQELGADFVSVLTPSYYKKNLGNDAMIKYYSDVADALTIPVIIYNAPGFSGTSLPMDVVEILSRHPNIAGMKDTSGNFIQYLELRSNEFRVLAGSITYLLPALVLGATGGVVSLADAFPDACCQLFEKFHEGDLEGATQDHYRLLRLSDAVSGTFGVAGVKHAMDLAGYAGGEPRLPLLPLRSRDKETIRNAALEAGVL